MPNDEGSSHPIQVAVESIDDAALVKVSAVESLVIASDFVRGTGFYMFEMGLMSYSDVGYFLIIANLSDIAAMGATPTGILTVIRYTSEVSDEQFTDVFKGMKSAADDYRVQIIGGDIGGYTANVFSATAFGFIETRNALLRKNVRDGDLLCLTGPIGLPITALSYFREAKGAGFRVSQGEEDELMRSWSHPTAKVAEGILLSSSRIANSCIDISDGLKGTIEQLTEISAKTFTIYADRLPIPDVTKKLAKYLGVDPIQLAMSASVDFELAFTIPRENEILCSTLFKKNNFAFYVIGEVNSEGSNLLAKKDGSKMELPGITWRQQTEDFIGEILKNDE